MSTAIEKYLARLKENFPDFQDFGQGSEAFDKEERAYKIELVELYRSTVAESLRHFPADEESQIAIGKKISALFTARLPSAGNKPQNLVGYRYFDPLKFEGSNYSKWALLVKQLIDSEGQLSEKIDQFVTGLYELIQKKVINNKIAFAALSRSVTSLLLMLSDPSQHAVIKTQEFKRALKTFGKPTLAGDRLTGQEYKRVQDFLHEVKTNLVQAGLHPRDLIDVQSLIWVGDEHYSSSDQVIEESEDTSQIDSQVTYIPASNAVKTLNRILYGPPGTGKTYRTVDEALSILDPLFLAKHCLDRVALKKRFDEFVVAEKIRFVTFHQSFSYEDFVEGLRPVNDAEGNLAYKVEPGVFKSLCESTQRTASCTDLGQGENALSVTPKVLIIDEINRGNVSRIFGELITLIESSKRTGNPEALQVTLPYSKESFGIPNNVYLIGTMNTADRSLSALDIALRRRFAFIEMLPQPEQLDDVNVANVINVGTLLRSMNQRIEVLLDRDHSLGHTYFLPLIQTPTLTLLATIFREQIVPLLEEYFFEDWERIHFVLNDHRKDDTHKFIARPKRSLGDILGNENAERFQDNRWEINQAAFDLPESYIRVYKDL